MANPRRACGPRASSTWIKANVGANNRERVCADAVAVTDASLYVLSRSRFAALEREHPALAAWFFERLARVISHRLRLADTELGELEER